MTVSGCVSQALLNAAFRMPHAARSKRHIAAVLCTLVFLAPLFAAAQSRDPEANRTTVFERADFLIAETSRPPADTAAWQAVALPHEWHRTHPGIIGRGWYRIHFELAQVPKTLQAVLIAHERAQAIDFFINGNAIGGARDWIAGAAVGAGFGSPLNLNIPPALMRAGDNVMHVRISTASHPLNIQGLGRVTFGDARPLRRMAAVHWEWGFYAKRTFVAMALTAGLITLFVWFARRSDRVMLWFSITCLSWAVANALSFWLRWSEMPAVNAMLSVYTAYGLVVPTVILCLRTVDVKWPRFEAALWVYLIAEVTYPLWLDVTNVLIRVSWDAANAALLLAGIGIVLYAAARPLRRPHHAELAALTMMAILMLYEAARYVGWVPIESPALRHYHVPLMLLAIGAAIFERHVLAVWRIEQTNLELERRVGEKAREIEAYHAERQEALRQRALVRERHRIITDMHDGLGASLVGLLRYVQSRPGDAHAIEQRVKEALQEMRIAIDALEPAQGDLAVILGKLRYRLDPLMEAAGVRLAWNVAELPTVEALDPSAVFTVQRAVLEAISNALKHSGAREIRLAALPKDEGIEIRIEDDGTGFDPARHGSGLGLGSMRARAERLGGRLEITSSADAGTIVIFTIPYTVAAEPAALAKDPLAATVPATTPPFAPVAA
jgi:signal transduction histidine kinase